MVSKMNIMGAIIRMLVLLFTLPSTSASPIIRGIIKRDMRGAVMFLFGCMVRGGRLVFLD